MAYNKHTWTTQELITSDKLNNIEDGINEIFDGFNKNESPIKSGTHSLSPVNMNRIINLSNDFNIMGFQEIITDPRSGYRYGFLNLDNDENSQENLGVVEYDQFLRIRSTMKVNHGVNRPSWLHGQFTQFNYYNTDKSKIEFLIGGPGELVKLEYKPNQTVDYDDLTVFATVSETNSYTQAIDFENNRLISAVLSRPATGKYTFSFVVYNIDSTSGATTFVSNHSITIDIPNGYVSQGISAAPASSYLGKASEGTMIFATSGGTNDDASYNELSVRMFLFEDGKLTEYGMIGNLENGGFKSSSNTRLVDSESVRNDVHEHYKEIEGSSQTKIDDKWVFTTNLIYSRDTLPFSQRNVEQLQLGFGDINSITKLKEIGKPKQTSYLPFESTITNISDVLLPGTYEISPTQISTLNDTPYFLKGDTTENTIGGTGLESIKLVVEKLGIYNRIQQTLILSPYSYTTNVPIKLTRQIRVNRDYGKDVSIIVGAWDMDEIKRIGNWAVFPKLNTSKLANIPGLSRFVTTSNLSTFFEGDNIVFTDSGLFQTLPYVIPLENSNTTTRLLQRYTTYKGAAYVVYERLIMVNSYGYSSTYPNGIGGGYPTINSVGNWVAIN